MAERGVDLFAGWGGFTDGAEQAGAQIVWAANHWPTAVRVHQQNHPGVEHVCQDLRQADWTALPDFDFLLASPACQPHSFASQPKRRPHHDDDRATAWAVVDCAEATQPRAIIVENVLNFRSRWVLYPVWKLALETLGYVVSEHVVKAEEHGVPQRRTRLFIVCTRKAVSLQLGSVLRRETPFYDCINESATGWRPISGAKPGARERILRSQKRHGSTCLVQHTSDNYGVPLTEAIRTITTKDQWVLVRGSEYRPLTTREYARGMGFGDEYTWPGELSRSDVVKGLGNAVPPPVARDVVRAVLEAA